MAECFDVIVLGVGAMGSAACMHLAQRGARVLGIEQFDIAHKLGSSGGDTRLIRMAYYEHPNYVPLLRQAYALWEQLQEQAGEQLLFRTGAVYMGPPGGELIAGSLRSAREHGLKHTLVEGPRVRERFGQFALPADFAAFHEADAGYVLSERAIAAMARQAVRHGAEIHSNTAVRNWEVREGRVIVRTDRAEYEAGHLILAPGAWTGGILRELPVPLQVTRQVLGWVRPVDPQPFRGAAPCWAIEHEGGLFYGFPIRDGAEEMKIAYHHRGQPADPNTLDRTTGTAEEADFRPLLARYLPAGNGPVRRMHICMYTYSPDGHFILDRHPQCEQVSIACGFSGHGFKFSPVIGRILADFAERGTTDLPADFLRLDRFKK